MESKVIELAKKLKALADRGIGGEKENAAVQLERLLKKYNLTIKDIEGEKLTERDFKVKGKLQRRFFWQIISSVIGKKELNKRGMYTVRNRTSISTSLTDSEFVEISEKMIFFWKHYLEESEIFFDAFVQKNKLFAKPDENESEKRDILSLEERQRLLKMMNMMEGIETAQYQKKLSNNN